MNTPTRAQRIAAAAADRLLLDTITERPTTYLLRDAEARGSGGADTLAAEFAEEVTTMLEAACAELGIADGDTLAVAEASGAAGAIRAVREEAAEITGLAADLPTAGPLMFASGDEARAIPVRQLRAMQLGVATAGVVDKMGGSTEVPADEQAMMHRQAARRAEQGGDTRLAGRHRDYAGFYDRQVREQAVRQPARTPAVAPAARPRPRSTGGRPAGRRRTNASSSTSSADPGEPPAASPAAVGRGLGFALLHTLTPGLPGHMRAALFARLPERVQTACWRALEHEMRRHYGPEARR